jgi:anti-anti-sigma factor
VEFPTDKVGKFMIVHVSGHVSDEKSQFLSKFLQDLANKGSQHIALNFENLTHMDSFAIGAFVHTYKGIKAKNGSMVIIGSHDFVDDMLKTLNIYSIIGFFPTLNDFKASIGA